MAFAYKNSPMDEMKQFKALHHLQPQDAAVIIQNGELLVDIVRQGHLRVLQSIVDHVEEGQILQYHAIKMFRLACSANRIDILHFMLLHGFNIVKGSLQDILHNIIDSIDVSSKNIAEEGIQPILHFLLDSGVDVNWQRECNLDTALHIASRKNLYCTASLLILYGADVNAVAMNNEMPLNCAENNSPDNDSSYDINRRTLLIQLLIENHAKRSWHRPSKINSTIQATIPLTLNASNQMIGTDV